MIDSNHNHEDEEIMGGKCEADFTYSHTKRIIQGDSGGKINILGSDSCVHCEKESFV